MASRACDERRIGRLELQRVHHQLQRQLVARMGRAGASRQPVSRFGSKPYLSISSQFRSHSAEHQISPVLWTSVLP